MATIPVEPESRFAEAATTPADIDRPDQSLFDAGYRDDIPSYQNHNYLFRRTDDNILHVFETGIPDWRTQITYPANAVTKEANAIYWNYSGSDSLGQQPSGTPSVWRAVLTDGNGKGLIISDTAPDAASRYHGLLWQNSSDERMPTYSWYEDGDSSQWVMIGCASGAVGNTSVMSRQTDELSAIQHDDGDGTIFVIPNASAFDATTRASGLATAATQAVVDAGTDKTQFVTPATLQNKPSSVQWNIITGAKGSVSGIALLTDVPITAAAITIPAGKWIVRAWFSVSCANGAGKGWKARARCFVDGAENLDYKAVDHDSSGSTAETYGFMGGTEFIETASDLVLTPTAWVDMNNASGTSEISAQLSAIKVG